MTSSFVAEANKLKNLQINIEKSESILFEHFSRVPECLELREYKTELEKARIKELELLQNETRNGCLLLLKLKEQINEKDVQDIDLTMLKKDMLNVQSNIQNMRYKHKIMLEKLERDEKALLVEMHAFEEKLAKWDSRPMVLQSTIMNKKPESVGENHFCQEVVDFFKFVTDSGGHDGGWSHDDHNLFLKIRARYKNSKKMADCFHALCPDLSVEEILEHENWYKTYLELKEKQKEAIKAWREKKNKELTRNVTKDKEAKSVTFVDTKKDGKNKEELQEKINNWKKEREMKKLLEIEAKKEEERKIKELEEKKRKEAEDLRMEIKHWKHTKVVKVQEDKIKKELAELKEKEYRIANAKKLIKQFQSHDDFYIERMKKSRKPKRSKSLERPRKKNTAPRDPERLLRPTKQWIFRTMPRRDDDEFPPEPKQVCNVRYVPKLGIPAWRKCM